MCLGQFQAYDSCIPSTSMNCVTDYGSTLTLDLLSQCHLLEWLKSRSPLADPICLNDLRAGHHWQTRSVWMTVRRGSPLTDPICLNDLRAGHHWQTWSALCHLLEWLKIRSPLTDPICLNDCKRGSPLTDPICLNDCKKRVTTDRPDLLLWPVRSSDSVDGPVYPL